MAHTPGPWKVQELLADGLIIKRDGCYEISTPNYDVVAYNPSAAPIRKLDDARLIAAAPGLLEALEGLLDAWESYEMLAALDINIAKKAEQAIALAKGVRYD